VDTRYLQRTSGGSYLISLPKEWVLGNGLSKGSPVGIASPDLGTLIVDPNPMGGAEPRSIELELTEDVGRALTASYLSGFERILIRGKQTITPSQKDRIKDSASRLAGLEIINETSDTVLLANLSVPVDLSVGDVMRRMHQIGSSMLVDAVESLVARDEGLSKNVIERDDALDRLYFLLIRLLKMAVRDLRMAEKMGVRPTQCLDLRFAASMMEKIGDKSVEMCELLFSTGRGVPEGARKISIRMGDLYREATQALLEGNFKLSSKVTRNRREVMSDISALAESGEELNEDAIGILDELADHIFDIADVVTEG
jgi:phosphate uptake regulator